MSELIIGPQSIFQEKYLQSDANIMVVGGAAGSSKSYVGLMKHLRNIEDPRYRGYCIRKNSTAIMKTGGLFDEAVHLYLQVDPDARIKLKDQKVVFSTGAEVAFSHYENTNAGQHLYQGLALSSVMYDEASHAEEAHIWWLISRLRGSSGVTNPQIWLTCNPDPDCYLINYVNWYLYPKGHPLEGRPDPEKNGVVRWLVRRDGDIVWGDSREELIERYGHSVRPLSFQGLFGTIEDNPTLLKNRPEYKANLEALPRVDRERLLHGNWFAREEGSGFFKREWLEEIPDAPDTKDFVKIVRAYDLAGSIKSEQNPDPDYSASVKMGKLKTGQYVILDAFRFRARFGEVTQKILETAAEDGTGVDIIIPSDPNSAAKAAATMMVSEIASHGYYARARPSNKSKVDRFRPFAAVAEHNLVKMVKHCVDDLENKTYGDNNPYYAELEKFDGGRKGHDDWCDATSDAFMALAQGINIPHLLLPDMKQSNPFNTP